MRFLIAASLLVAAPAAAQSVERDALIACAVKTDDAARLACFDAIAAAFSPELRAAAAKREAAAAQARAVRAAEEARLAEQRKTAAFGGETMPLGTRAERPTDRLEELKARISEVLTGRPGMGIVFLLDNGMLWRQADAFSLPPIRPDAEVLLRRGPLGSYKMTLLRNNRTFNVVRVR